MSDITDQRLMALEARVIALENEAWDLKRRLAATEAWQRDTDDGFKAFPAALQRAFRDA